MSSDDNTVEPTPSPANPPHDGGSTQPDVSLTADRDGNKKNDSKGMEPWKIGIAIAGLVLGLVVALFPGVIYAPVPRVVLFVVLALIPAILFGDVVGSRVEIKAGWFVATIVGAGAVFFVTLWFLTEAAKPEEQIAVYHVFDENNQEVPLEYKNAVKVYLSQKGLTVTTIVQGNTVVLIFPEQVGSVELAVRKSPSGAPYYGTVSYAGSRASKLFLGSDLKKKG